MFINQKLGEIHLKIVYYGPSLSGKTTNLQYIHRHINPNMRGELVSLKTREDRTIYFDFMQLELSAIRGLKPKFSLYTVPGQVYYAASRKLVLNGADGVVFVADSQRNRLKDNRENLSSLVSYLRRMGYDPKTFPLVMQFNKQDLVDVYPPDRMLVYLAGNGLPYFGSIATEGEGVFETLKTIINTIVRGIH